MKYKKRYNILVVLLLFIIAGSVACYSLLNLDHVESAEDDTVINVIEDEEVKEDSVETTPSKKVQFTQFSTALKYAYNYLNNAQGYKSYIHGFFSLSVANIIDISQDVDVYASVNNRENKYRAVVQTTGTGKIKRAHDGKNHILTKKTRKRKRNLKKAAYVSKSYERNIKAMM